MSLRRMSFGIFMAPFHWVGDNPTLAIERDIELIQWMDRLGYDEAWIGEHHSAGWETIASPELIIAAAAERTKHIRLGSGVTSLPYHHPFLVAQRFVQLDHMTRGRAMLGCGPGALSSDAYMMGIDPVTQRPRMDEALGAIMQLLTSNESVTIKTDWFELRDARLHLRPYTHPHLPIAVASTTSPAGMVTAGKFGVGVLNVGGGLPGGPQKLAEQWRIAEETAEQHGTSVSRDDWRLVCFVHVAETRKQAVREVEAGYQREQREYWQGTLKLPAPRSSDPLADGLKAGTHLVGSPEDVIDGIHHLQELSQGGFGALLFQANEWATREATLRSYELFARYVMPHFQGQIDGPRASNEWATSIQPDLQKRRGQAMIKAFADAGKEMTPEMLAFVTRQREGEGTLPGGARL